MAVEEYDAAPCLEYGNHRPSRRHRREECPAVTRPLENPCPACQAPAGSPCTQPTDTGRKPVKWVHLGRQEAL